MDKLQEMVNKVNKQVWSKVKNRFILPSQSLISQMLIEKAPEEVKKAINDGKVGIYCPSEYEGPYLRIKN